MAVFAAFPANIRHMFPVMADRFAAFFTDFRHVFPILADGFTALAADFRHVSPVLADGFTAFAADFRHVLPVLADCFAAFMARLARFFGIKLVRGPFFMSGMTALTGYLALLVLIHGGETTVAGTMPALCHHCYRCEPLPSCDPRPCDPGF